MITEYDKAIAAGMTVLAAFGAKYGFDIKADPELYAAVTTIATMFVVWLVPNRKPVTKD